MRFKQAEDPSAPHICEDKKLKQKVKLCDDVYACGGCKTIWLEDGDEIFFTCNMGIFPADFGLRKYGNVRLADVVASKLEWGKVVEVFRSFAVKPVKVEVKAPLPEVEYPGDAPEWDIGGDYCYGGRGYNPWLGGPPPI